MVIGAVESNEADHKAADELKAALGVKSKELAAALNGFWRSLRALVGTRDTRTALGITTGHNADNPDQPLIVHLFAVAHHATSGVCAGGFRAVFVRQARGGPLRSTPPARHPPTAPTPP